MSDTIDMIIAKYICIILRDGHVDPLPKYWKLRHVVSLSIVYEHAKLGLIPESARVQVLKLELLKTNSYCNKYVFIISYS